MFYKKIKKSSKKEMVDYLAGHFRYYTMNPWNKSTSYANNVKIYNVIPQKLQNKACEIAQQGNVYYAIRDLLSDFGRKYDYEWQAGFNGRSNGYIVLYQGGKRKLDYKTQCDSCGKLTWYETEQNCHVDGCNGMLRIIKRPVYDVYTVYTCPGLGLDENEDFSAWDIEDLRDRVSLVQEFDKLCDDVVNLFISYCEDYNVEEKIVMVPRVKKVLVTTR